MKHSKSALRLVDVPAFTKIAARTIGEAGSRDAALRLAEVIRAAWAKVGRTIEIDVVPSPSASRYHGEPIWETVSRTKNGVPV